MANPGERLINAVNRTSRRCERGLSQKSNGVGTGMYGDLSWTSNAPGKQSEPNQPELNVRNVVNPMLRPETGRETVRRPDGAAGKGRWKKRKPVCNGQDRAAQKRRYPPRKWADFHGVFRHERA